MADVTEEPEAESEPDHPPRMDKVMEFIENHPYPEFEEVLNLFDKYEIDAWEAYDKSNHAIIAVLYQNIHDVDMIHQGADMLAAGPPPR
eukprot:15363765-Heterocapsa_arctica.AAC.1